MENTLEIKFLGAIGTVTGSCTAIRFSNANGTHLYLVDVGEYQGERVCEKGREWLNKNAKHVEGIFITHAHYDHVGYLPELVMDHGFHGTVYCSKATEELMKAILADSLKINRARYSVKEVFGKIKIYYLDNFTRGKQFVLCDDFTVTTLNSAHVLGSVEFSFARKINDKWETLIFSGDIGPNEELIYTNILLRDFQYPFFSSETGKINIVLESTYGNRVKDKEDVYERRLEKLTEIITDAMANNRTVVFPAFALNRSQEILLDLYYLGMVRKIGLDRYLKNVTARYEKKKLDDCFVVRDSIMGPDGEQQIIERLDEIKSEFIAFLEKEYPELPIDWNAKVSNLPEDVIYKIAELRYKYRPTRTFYPQADSALMAIINSIYNKYLLTTRVKKDESLGYEYLSKPFFEEFSLSHLSEQEKIDQAKDIIDSALLWPTSMSNDSKKNKDKDHKKDNAVAGSFKIIVSSSGMCDEGAVLWHLKKYLPDENAVIVLTGYQANHTNGYHLKNMHGYKEIEKISVTLNNIGLRLSNVKCKIEDMSEYYTGHADQDMLFRYVTGCDEKPNTLPQTNVFLNHGNDEARNALKERLLTAPNIKVEIPTTLSWYNLDTGEQVTDEEDEKRLEPETGSQDDTQDDIKRLEIGDITILIPSRHLRKIKELLETIT